MCWWSVRTGPLLRCTDDQSQPFPCLPFPPSAWSVGRLPTFSVLCSRAVPMRTCLAPDLSIGRSSCTPMGHGNLWDVTQISILLHKALPNHSLSFTRRDRGHGFVRGRHHKVTFRDSEPAALSRSVSHPSKESHARRRAWPRKAP